VLLTSFDMTANLRYFVTSACWTFCAALKNASLTPPIGQWRPLLKARVRIDGEYFEYAL